MKNKVIYPQTGIRVGGSVVSTSMITKGINKMKKFIPIVYLPCEGPNSKIFHKLGVITKYYNIDEKNVLFMQNKIGLRNIISFIKVYKKSLNILKREKPDIVHINDDQTLNIWGFAAKKFGIPVIWHIRQERSSKLDRLRMQLSDYIIFISDYNRIRFSKYMKLPPNETIPNPVDFDSFYPNDSFKAKKNLGLKPNIPLIGFIGNWVPRKRPEWFVEIAINILKAGYDAQFVVVGDDYSKDCKYSNEVMAKVKKENLENNIINFGYRENVPDILRAFDIFVLCSTVKGEAFPRVVLEAMATGVPVVATKVAGLPDQVVHEETGLLVDPCNQKDLQEAVVKLLKNPQSRYLMGVNGLKRAKNLFSIESCVEKIAKVYEHVLENQK